MGILWMVIDEIDEHMSPYSPYLQGDECGLLRELPDSNVITKAT